MGTTDRRRDITDVRVLAALAHPVRLQLLHHLLAVGARTATECSGVVDASPSACSYHLRHLERFELVERVAADAGETGQVGKAGEAGTAGQAGTTGRPADGRERRWRCTAAGFNFGPAPSADHPEMQAARYALAAAGVDVNERDIRRYLRDAGTLPSEWQDSAMFSTYALTVTATELSEVCEAIDALLRPLRSPVRTDAPPDARQVRVIVNAFARTDL